MDHKVYWTPQKIAQRIDLIEPLVYRKRHPLPAFRYKALASPLAEPEIGEGVDDSAWETIEPNSYWGKWFTDFMLRTRFEIPADWDKDAPVALYLPFGNAGDFSHPEALAYIDGQSYASADRHHHEIVLPASVHDGKSHLLDLHGWTGGKYRLRNSGTQLFMKECAVVQIDQPTRDLHIKAKVALGIADLLDDNDPVKGRLHNALDAAFKAVDTRDPLRTDVFYDSVPDAVRTLEEGIASAGLPLDVDVIGIGHAHIDVAWLWQLGHTVRKSGRTFSNVLRLMEQYPEYTFTQSQPQLYKYTEEHYPEIFEGIKQRVAEGRWELIGGTWVEPDCNAIGAEALARQFLLGRNYFRKHFGDVDTPLLWLPDTFGYSWALPQLIKLAGMKYFITHKMSWNQYNHMPSQILWWQGIDGTKVLTHFLTTPSGSVYLPHSTTYNGVVSPEEIVGTWNNFRQKETHNELITAYGYGDGGGGPTSEMLENIRALSNHAGAPRVRTGTVREYMERLENGVQDDLPVWNGEFYLEYHRGTLTSQARTKRNNRKSEFLLHDAEYLASLASIYTDYDYPTDTLNQAWELVCLNQFHDILPGSSITPVYDDADRDYSQIMDLGHQVKNAVLGALASALPDNTTAFATNPISFSGNRFGVLEGDHSGLVDLRDGTALPTQSVDGGTLVEISNLDGYALVPMGAGDGSVSISGGVNAKQDGSNIFLENELIQVEIDAKGDITRIYDKEATREVLAEGETGNQLQAFEDRPMQYDAWDIDIYFEDRMEKVEGLESLTIIESGPLRAGVEVKRRYRNSTINQTIYLYRDNKRIDFETTVDWHDQNILLKVGFPVNVLSPRATFEIQWGNVERSTHFNTSWDWARFETCAHKWADLSEGDYGVALLNDCKYGYDVHDNLLRLTLLKSATYPDPQADQGEHLMTYSLFPHTGDWRNGVTQAGYDLNDPLILEPVTQSGRGGESAPDKALVSVDAP